MKLVVLFVALMAAVQADVHFQENFDGGWEDRWVYSSLRKDQQGKFKQSAGKFYGDKDRWVYSSLRKDQQGKFKQSAGKFYGDKDNMGIQTSQDAKFYALSSKIEKPFSNEGK